MTEFRKMRLILLCINAILLASANGIKNPKVAKAFSEFELTPCVFPIPPEELLNLKYPTAEACLGERISQTRTLVQPKIEYNFKSGVNYTIILIDPDVPTARAPQLRSYLNWMRVNVALRWKGEDPVGYTVASYIPPTPYPGSGVHRYTSVLYEQKKGIDLEEIDCLRLGIKRYRFDVIAFAEEFDLGNPIAGNFFRVRVPALYDEYYCVNCTICPPGQKNTC